VNPPAESGHETVALPLERRLPPAAAARKAASVQRPNTRLPAAGMLNEPRHKRWCLDGNRIEAGVMMLFVTPLPNADHVEPSHLAMQDGPNFHRQR